MSSAAVVISALRVKSAFHLYTLSLTTVKTLSGQKANTKSPNKCFTSTPQGQQLWQIIQKSMHKIVMAQTSSFYDHFII